MRVTLGELAVFKGGSVFPREEQGGSVRDLPFAKVSDLARTLGERDIDDAAEWISEEQRIRLHPAVAAKNDVLFAKIGEGLKSERFRLARRDIAFDNNMMVAKPKDSCYGLFLFYLLRTLNISQYANGSALPYLTQGKLSGIPVEVPSLPEQRAIAEVLGALDDKIAANNRAVAMSNDYRSTLFIKAINYQKKGVLNDYTELLMRGRMPSYTDSMNGQLVINQKCIRDGQVLLSEARRTSKIEAGERRICFGDSLVNSTGVGTLGRVGIWTAGVDATVDSHVTIVRFPKESFPLCRAQLLASMQSSIEALAEGSTGQTELGRENLRKIPFFGLNDRAEEIEQKLLNAHHFEGAMEAESRTLASLRDTLLPALMNGTLRVKDAEKQVGEVL